MSKRGRAGKGAGTSVSGGAPAKAAAKGLDLASASMDQFASAVQKATDAVKINSLAPIAQVHAELKTDMPLAAFKEKLLRAYREDKVDLARNDLGIDRYPADLLRRSEADMSGRVFVFVRRRAF